MTILASPAILTEVDLQQRSPPPVWPLSCGPCGVGAGGVQEGVRRWQQQPQEENRRPPDFATPPWGPGTPPSLLQSAFLTGGVVGEDPSSEKKQRWEYNDTWQDELHSTWVDELAQARVAEEHDDVTVTAIGEATFEPSWAEAERHSTLPSFGPSEAAIKAHMLHSAALP